VTKTRNICTIGNFPKSHGFQPSLCLRLYTEIVQVTSRSHEDEHVRSIGQGEGRHGKYKRLKLGGGQAYDRSSDYAAVVASVR
jgi:hypothetical protein